MGIIKTLLNKPQFKAVLGVLIIILLVSIFPFYSVLLFCIAYVLFGVVMITLGIIGLFIIPYDIFLKAFKNKNKH